MSSTRHVESGERRQQNGWASSPEFDELRGLNGTAVALKAAILDDPKKRQLLYFIQALSQRDGGLQRLARELVEMFPERIGTPSMHSFGCKPGKVLTDEQCRKIYRGLTPVGFNYDVSRRQTALYRKSADYFLNECRGLALNLDERIEEFCCAPGFDTVQAKYFHDTTGALFEYQRRQIERACANYVETSIGKIVFEAMDYVLQTGRSALIEGKSGFGKTTTLKAWCEMHLGQARYVQLTGITTRTTFFRKLAKALGVASGGGMSSGRVQTRVEDFLQRTKLILVIDEGQYLWPQGKRIESHPELINWLNTACYNEGVPFVISATRQFTLRRQAVEKSTDWSSEQSRRRTRRTFDLPDVPTKEDLKAVARKLLADLGGNSNAVDLVVGYALTSRGYFQTITDAIDDARLMAKRGGRDRITFKDLKSAVYEWRAPSDAALQRVFDTKPEGGRRRQAAPVPNEELANDHAPVVDRLRGSSESLRSARPGLVAIGDG